MILGPYQEYIAALSGSNPGLKKPDPNNAKHPLTDNNALVVLLDLPTAENSEFKKTEFRGPQDLAEHFQEAKSMYGADVDHGRRRIYIMEGLAKKYISIMGGHFMMDPSFFQRQERTCVWSNEFTPVSDALPHPSLLDPEKSFHLQYCELRQFNKAIENQPYFCNRTMRHVGMTPPRHKEDSTTGILRRKISWWCRRTPKGGWDGMWYTIVCALISDSICSCHPLRSPASRTEQTASRVQQNQPHLYRPQDVRRVDEPFFPGGLCGFYTIRIPPHFCRETYAST